MSKETAVSIIEAEKLCYAYKSLPMTEDGAEDSREAVLVPALSGVTLTVGKGEFVAVLGRNGSGKSTFAKIVNALLTPTEGSIRVGGLDATVPDNAWNIRQMAGMVFQNPDNQIIATIVEEDVAFGPENLGIPTAEIRRRVDWALETVGMTEYAGHSPHFLSGGQKQRVSIAGVLAMKPDIIILDEPTAMLDPIGRREVLAAVSRLNREEKMTVVLITHYMEEAAMAGRVVVMDSGRVVLDAPPKEVFAQADMLRGLGLDVPQIMEIGRRLNALGYDVPVNALTLEEMVEALCRLR